MEAPTEKKAFSSWWWLLFIYIYIFLWPHSSNTTKSSTERAREFLVGKWAYYDTTAKPGQRKGILIISPDGTCRVGKQLGRWDYSEGYASIAIGKNSSVHYYDLDQKEGSLIDHGPKGKTLTKIAE